MFKNIFKKTAKACCEFTISKANDIKFTESDLLEFMVLQEMSITQATLENTRYCYMGEKESCGEIIQESTTNFFNKMVEFFKNLLIKIREFFSKIFLYIQSLMGGTESLIKNAGSSMLKKDSSFIIQGYSYTIKDNIPDLKRIEKLVSEYNGEYNNIQKMKIADITKKREEFMNNLSKIRGEIIGINQPIEAGDFRDTVNKLFRDDEDTTKDITVDKSHMEKIINSYSNLKKTYNDCVAQKRKVELQLEGLKKYFETGSRDVKFIDGEKKKVNRQIELTDNGVVTKKENEAVTYATADSLKVMNAYFNYRFTESKELSNIILTVLSCKTTALKEQLKQYDTCVRKWIYVKPESNDDKEDN